MRKRTNNQLPTNLLQLQNVAKREPDTYKEEFLQQVEHYKAYLEIFQLKTNEYIRELDQVVFFLSHVAHRFADDLKDFPNQLMEILQNHKTTLDPEMRLCFCRALILLRNKGLLDATALLELFFGLLECQDKNLRSFLQSHITADIKRVNVKHKNAKLNSTLQGFMYAMLQDNNKKAVKMSLDIMIDLYDKQIWNDAKTANAIAEACFSRVTKIMVTGIKFFLTNNEKKEDGSDKDSSDEDSDAPTAKDLIMAVRVNKKRRKRLKQLEKAKAVLKKNKTKKKERAPIYHFSALHLIYDAQTVAEKLFKQLQSRNERFEVKLMTIDLISRLIGIHQLILLNFYPFLQRFLEPHQREVTKLLQYTAQACHELVPPDELEKVLMCVANNFVTERNSAEVMTVGLNTIREMCVRTPYVMNEDLLTDLCSYKTYRDKNVAMAAKSLIQLYRNVNPKLLNRKHRSRPSEATKELVVKQFGQLTALDYVSGAEALEINAEEGAEEKDWESEGEDNDSDGWVTVIHSGEEKEEKEEKEEMDDVDKVTKATAVSQGRILTQEEFKKIRITQLSKQMEPARKNKKGEKRKSDSMQEIDVEDVDDNGELVSLSAIERLHKKPKSDKQSRLATVMEGREGREKFGRRRKPKNPHASISNKRKKKTKNFMMVKHKIRAKQKRSFREKQIALRNALLKQKRMK